MTVIPAATHIPLLSRIFDISEGDVLELGTGLYSTPLLNWLSQLTGRQVYSCENSAMWIESLKKYESENQHIIDVSKFIEEGQPRGQEWDKLQIEPHGGRWGMVFIDMAPATARRTAIRRYAAIADYIVVHDTEPGVERFYRMARPLSKFKYRYDYTKLIPNTTVVSNTHENF